MGIVPLAIDDAVVDAAREHLATDVLKGVFAAHRDAIRASVMRARYGNLHGLLGDNLSEETYLRIVENQILVDIQGQDILYQVR